MVCSSCHQGLGAGKLAVNSTGEFRVPPELIEPSEITGERLQTTNVCAWCGKLEHEVKKLLGRGKVALCDECVSLCCDILDAELGQNWR